MWRHSKKTVIYMPGRELSGTSLSVLWSWTSLLLELWEINFFCLRHAGYAALLWQAEQSKTLYPSFIEWPRSYSHYTFSADTRWRHESIKEKVNGNQVKREKTRLRDTREAGRATVPRLRGCYHPTWKERMHTTCTIRSPHPEDKDEPSVTEQMGRRKRKPIHRAQAIDFFFESTKLSLLQVTFNDMTLQQFQDKQSAPSKRCMRFGTLRWPKEWFLNKDSS